MQTRNVLALVILSSLVFLAANVWALPLEKKTCPSPQTLVEKPTTKVEIDKRWAPKQILDQGEFGTCYAFAAYYSLQYLLNEYLQSTDKVLSLPHLLSSAYEGTYPIGGFPFSLIHNLGLEPEIALDPKWTHYSAIFKEENAAFIHCPLKLTTLSADKLYNLVAATCLPLVKATRESQVVPTEADPEYPDDFDPPDDEASLREHLKTCKDPQTILSKGIFEFSQYDPGKIKLPPTNVHAYSFADVPSEEKTDTLFKMLTGVLKKNHPVNLSVSAGKEEGHSMTVTGVKEECCQTATKALVDCERVVEVVNSHAEGPGWYKVGPLAQKTLWLNYSKVCFKRKKGVKIPIGQDACVPHIRGNAPKIFAIASQDLNGLDKYLQGKPDKFAKKAEKNVFFDGASFYRATPKFVLELADILHRHHIPLDESDSLGRNALHSLVIINKTAIIPAVVQSWIKHGKSLDQADHKGETPLHFAISDGTPETLQEVVKAWSANHLSCTKKNTEGRTPFEDGVQLIAEIKAKAVKIFLDAGKKKLYDHYVDAQKRIQAALDKYIELRMAQFPKPLIPLAEEGDLSMLKWIKDNRPSLWREIKAKTSLSNIFDRAEDLKSEVFSGTASQKAKERAINNEKQANLQALNILFTAK